VPCQPACSLTTSAPSPVGRPSIWAVIWLSASSDRAKDGWVLSLPGSGRVKRRITDRPDLVSVSGLAPINNIGRAA